MALIVTLSWAVFGLDASALLGTREIGRLDAGRLHSSALRSRRAAMDTANSSAAAKCSPVVPFAEWVVIAVAGIGAVRGGGRFRVRTSLPENWARATAQS